MSAITLPQVRELADETAALARAARYLAANIERSYGCADPSIASMIHGVRDAATTAEFHSDIASQVLEDWQPYTDYGRVLQPCWRAAREALAKIVKIGEACQRAYSALADKQPDARKRAITAR